MSLRITSLKLLSSCRQCLVRNEVRWNCNHASLGKINRSAYPKMYTTTLVLSDGSTIRFRHHEPRQVLKLPMDLSMLSDEERAIVLARRKPKQKVVVEEEIEDDFDVDEYSHLWKEKKVI